MTGNDCAILKGKGDRKNMKLQIEYLPIDELKPYDKNTRKHADHDVDEIAKSIEKYGFSDPIGIWGDGNIIVEGHGRLLAAKKLGMNVVPVMRLDHLTDEERREYAIMHNRTAELSAWDFEMLESELADLSLDDFDFDLEELNISAADFDEGAELDEVEVPDAPKVPKSCRGQIWQLGKHRLMCGDSTSADDVSELMNGAEADCFVTDPPYNVSYEGGTKDKLTIENDSMDAESFQTFLLSAFENAHDSLRPGGAFYVWYASREVVNFMTALNKAGFEVRQELIWNKNSLVLGRQDYQWKHEPCLYGWKDGAAHYFIEDRTLTTVMDFNRPTANKEHPTMKPIELIGHQIKNSTKRGEVVLDLFGGSGSTLLACEQLGRSCYMMEYDPKYADVIIKRWELYTGEKAVLLND